jgi:DNA-binding CsgD family transcriptional regulator
LSITRDDASAAEDEGLLIFDRKIEFRHPLIRSAVYHGAPLRERRRVHQTLAAVDGTLNSDGKAWHLAAAADGPDEDVAVELERSAARAQRRGGHATVAISLARAADLTPDPERRAERLLDAAEAALFAGSPRMSRGLLERASPQLDALGLRARAQRLQGTVQLQLAEMAEAPSTLLAAARAFDPGDGVLRRDTLLAAMEAAMIARQFTERTTTAEIAEAALDELRDSRTAPTVADLLLEGYAARTTIGFKSAVPFFRKAIDALCNDSLPPVGIIRWSLLGSIAARDIWDDAGRRTMLVRMAQLERAQGALAALRTTLRALAVSETWSGRFAVAAGLYEESWEITAAIGGARGRWDLLQAELLAWQGRDAETRAAVTVLVGQVAGQSGIGAALETANSALSILELGSGRYSEALASALPAFEEDAPASGNRALQDLIEAAVRTGNTDTATAALDRLGERALASATPWALGVLARSRALLASDTTADSLYREAVEHLGRTTVVTDLARAHLVYGEWLRRQRRRADARDQLHIAYDLFSRMGAAAFAERAHGELLATGERARKRTLVTTNDLTPREGKIASMAAYGATNAEIAAQLFLSPSTIDYHLRHVYQKLNVSSRRQLAHALPTDTIS